MRRCCMILLVLSLASQMSYAQVPRSSGGSAEGTAKQRLDQVVGQIRQIDADQRFLNQARLDYNRTLEVGGGVFLVSTALAVFLAKKFPKDGPPGYWSRIFARARGRAVVPSGAAGEAAAAGAAEGPVIEGEMTETTAQAGVEGVAAEADAGGANAAQPSRIGRARQRVGQSVGQVISMVPRGKDMTVGALSMIGGGAFVVTSYELYQIEGMIDRANRALAEERQDLEILEVSLAALNADPARTR